MPEDQPSRPTHDKIQNFNFLLSRQDKNRQYSFDADTGLAPFANVNMDYDQTEGMGGLSVSSYDSIDDDRSSLDLRGYPYQGTSKSWQLLCCPHVAFVAPSSCLMVRLVFWGDPGQNGKQISLTFDLVRPIPAS